MGRGRLLSMTAATVVARVRPIWHQLERRVHAHILVCILAYVLWKTLEQ
jgi:hypothetical protein